MRTEAERIATNISRLAWSVAYRQQWQILRSSTFNFIGWDWLIVIATTTTTRIIIMKTTTTTSAQPDYDWSLVAVHLVAHITGGLKRALCCLSETIHSITTKRHIIRSYCELTNRLFNLIEWIASSSTHNITSPRKLWSQENFFHPHSSSLTALHLLL